MNRLEKKTDANKLTAKQYREFILGCVDLYGVVDSDDAFLILKNYFPSAKKKDFITDLKKRNGRYTKDYEIWSTTRRNCYLICSWGFSEEEMDYIIPQQSNKPFYIPKTYESFLSCSDFKHWKANNSKIYEKFVKILAKRKGNEAEKIAEVIFDDIKTLCLLKDANEIEYVLKRLNLWGFDFNNSNELNEIAYYVQSLCNNTRMGINRGHTPNEMVKLSGGINPSNIQMSIGPNMRKMFEDGEMDLKEYLDGIINSDLPENIKKSLIKELTEIKKGINEA